MHHGVQSPLGSSCQGAVELPRDGGFNAAKDRDVLGLGLWSKPRQGRWGGGGQPRLEERVWQSDGHAPSWRVPLRKHTSPTIVAN
jgi:hypothetical protein